MSTTTIARPRRPSRPPPPSDQLRWPLSTSPHFTSPPGSPQHFSPPRSRPPPRPHRPDLSILQPQPHRPDPFTLQPHRPDLPILQPHRPDLPILQPHRPDLPILQTSFQHGTGHWTGDGYYYPPPPPNLTAFAAAPPPLGRPPLGPPPSARRGPASYYPPRAPVQPIVEEQSPPPQSPAPPPMVIPPRYFRHHRDSSADFVLDESDDEEDIGGDPAPPAALIRQASLGRKSKPTLTTITPPTPDARRSPRDLEPRVAPQLPPPPLPPSAHPVKPRDAPTLFLDTAPQKDPQPSQPSPLPLPSPALSPSPFPNHIARASLTSLPDLIHRATTLASNLDRGRTASRLGLRNMLSTTGRTATTISTAASFDSTRPRSDASLSLFIAAFPSPAGSTTRLSLRSGPTSSAAGVWSPLRGVVPPETHPRHVRAPHEHDRGAAPATSDGPRGALPACPDAAEPDSRPARKRHLPVWVWALVIVAALAGVISGMVVVVVTLLAGQ